MEILKNTKLLISIVTFFISNLYLFSFVNLNFLSTASPDFQYYRDYFEYFFNDFETTNREQGLLYYFIVSLFIKLRSIDSSFNLENELISNSIQFANISIYLFGLFGLYLLLNHHGFSSHSIIVTFTALGFFPQTINMIITMKPEVLAFAFLCWLFFFLENYITSNEIIYLLLSTIPLIFLITSKGTIIGMTLLLGILFLIFNWQKIVFKDLLLLFGVSLLLSLPIFYENFMANSIFVLNHVPGETGLNMNQVADISFLYNVNIQELYMSPFKNFHANSLFGIVSLDTFGDYFRWYAYNDESAFKYIKYDLKGIWYISYWRETFSIILTVTLYFIILYFMRTFNSLKIYLLLPFIGLFVLLLQAYGFPSRNFNKQTAELFKTHYYSFFLIITISFVLVLIFKNYKYFGISFVILIMFNSFYLYGIPLNTANNYSEYLNEKNQFSLFCGLNQKLYASIQNNNCHNNVCDISNPLSKFREKNVSDYTKNVQISNEYILINSKNQIVTVTDVKECNNYLNMGYKINSIFLNDLRLPKINILYLVVFLNFLLFYLYKNIKIKSNEV